MSRFEGPGWTSDSGEKAASVFFLAVALAAMALLPGCGRSSVDPAATSPPLAPPSSASTPSAPLSGASSPDRRGITLTPKSFSAKDFVTFLEQAKLAGGVLSWAGDWNELTTENGGPRTLIGLAEAYNLTPVVQAQFFTQADGRLLRPLDAATLVSYQDAAVAFARDYSPPYLALGVEVNVLYEKSPADFDRFVQAFGGICEAVKAVSPGTKVFTVFQLEKMKGLGGGLFGGVSDPAQAEWALLGWFPKADLAAFTTYPGLIYKDPADLPADYYTEIASHTSLPIAFTEVGWPSGNNVAGWESSEVEQTEFVTVFFDLTEPLGVELAIWSFAYDQATAPPFDTMGLVRPDGTPRPAWNEWTRP